MNSEKSVKCHFVFHFVFSLPIFLCGCLFNFVLFCAETEVPRDQNLVLLGLSHLIAEMMLSGLSAKYYMVKHLIWSGLRSNCRLLCGRSSENKRHVVQQKVPPWFQ